MSFCLPYMLLLQGRRRNWSQINNSPKLQIQIDLLFYLISGSDQSLWSLPGSRTEKTLAGYLLYIFVLCRSINLLTCGPESWAGDMSGLGQVSSRPGWRYIEQWEYVHLRSCHLYWIIVLRIMLINPQLDFQSTVICKVSKDDLPASDREAGTQSVMILLYQQSPFNITIIIIQKIGSIFF